MMDAFITISQIDHRTIKSKAQSVAVQLNQLVNEMATRNADLVDIQFLISYLGRLVHIPYLVSEKLVRESELGKLLQEKLENESEANAWVDTNVNIQDAFDIAWKFKLQKLDDLLIEKVLSKPDVVLSYDVINKASLAIKRKYAEASAEERDQVYQRLCDTVTEYNKRTPSKRYQNALALAFMPKDSDIVEQTISAEIEIMKQEGKIARNA